MSMCPSNQRPFVWSYDHIWNDSNLKATTDRSQMLSFTFYEHFFDLFKWVVQKNRRTNFLSINEVNYSLFLLREYKSTISIRIKWSNFKWFLFVIFALLTLFTSIYDIFTSILRDFCWKHQAMHNRFVFIDCGSKKWKIICQQFHKHTIANLKNCSKATEWRMFLRDLKYGILF